MSKQKFAQWALKRMGWTAAEGVVPEPKCIMLGVPHTSVWDFVIAWLYYTSVGGLANIMIKKEFFFWPIGGLLKRMGAVPVDRSKGAITAKHVIEIMQKAESMHLGIAPEGTRKKTARWKSGFLTIAKACNIPVYLGYYDYSRKRVGRGVRFMPTGNTAEDLKKIMAHYAAMHMEGRHKGQFDAGKTEQLIEPEE